MTTASARALTADGRAATLVDPRHMRCSGSLHAPCCRDGPAISEVALANRRPGRDGGRRIAGGLFFGRRSARGRTGALPRCRATGSSARKSASWPPSSGRSVSVDVQPVGRGREPHGKAAETKVYLAALRDGVTVSFVIGSEPRHPAARRRKMCKVVETPAARAGGMLRCKVPYRGRPRRGKRE